MNAKDAFKSKPHPKCLLTELEDGSGVVLNLETKFYHTLNATAVLLWKGLGSGATERELANKLAAEFEVGEETALVDVKIALEEFEREGLIVVAAAKR